MTTAGPAPDEPLQARIDALRSRGASHIDPLRLLQLEALSRRLAGQPAPVQAVLRQKVEAALADLAQRLENAPVMQAPAATVPPRIATRPAARAARPAWPAASPSQGELASVGRFRRAWSRTRAQDSVAQAAAQRPANAGPLNSHVLLLQSLDLMGTLSADYLRRFVAHAESLLWLEAMGAQAAAAPARKPKRRS